jgi:hypothetical protein
MIRTLEGLMYTLSAFFMAPVLILLVSLFGYSLYALGGFACQYWQRRTNQAALTLDEVKHQRPRSIKGYPLLCMFRLKPTISKDELDVAALQSLEAVRTVSRIAPMLGLIATMIPMGPALKSLANGNVQGISENLIVAFSAVIFGLVIASITFFIASIKKRWLAVELVAIGALIDGRVQPTQEAALREVA